MKNYLLLILCVIFFARCYKEDTNVKYDPNPIKLNATHSFKGTKLTWTTLPQSAEFVSYRVYRSINNDTINEKNLSANAFVAFSTTDNETSSFFDNSQGFGTIQGVVYYRVEVVFKNRSVWSKNVLLVDNAKIINEDFSNIYTDKETSKLYLYNDIEGVMKIYNLEQQKLLDANLKFAPFAFIGGLAFGTFNGSREMYITDSTDLRIYDANTFELIKTIDLQHNVSGIIIGKNNVLYISIVNSVYDVLVFDRNTETKTLHTNSGNTVNLVLMYLPNKNKLVALNFKAMQPTLNYFELSADGKTITASSPNVSVGNKLASTNNFTLINYLSNNETFVIGNQVSIFDKDFKFIASPPQEFNGIYNNFTVTKDDNIIEVRQFDSSIRQSNSKGIVTNKLIIKYFPKQIINIKDKSWIICNSNNNNLVNTIIEKFEF